jgi:hypothetical protein
MYVNGCSFCEHLCKYYNECSNTSLYDWFTSFVNFFLPFFKNLIFLVKFLLNKCRFSSILDGDYSHTIYEFSGFNSRYLNCIDEFDIFFGNNLFYKIFVLFIVMLFLLFLFDLLGRLFLIIFTPYNTTAILTLIMIFFHNTLFANYDFFSLYIMHHKNQIKDELVISISMFVLVYFISHFFWKPTIFYKHGYSIHTLCELTFGSVLICYYIRFSFLIFLKILYTPILAFFSALKTHVKNNYLLFVSYFSRSIINYTNVLIASNLYRDYCYSIYLWRCRWSASKISCFFLKNPSSYSWILMHLFVLRCKFEVHLETTYRPIQLVMAVLSVQYTMLLIFTLSVYAYYLIIYCVAHLLLHVAFFYLIYFVVFTYLNKFLFQFIKFLHFIEHNVFYLILMFLIFNFLFLFDFCSEVDMILLKKFFIFHRHRTSYTWFFSGKISYGVYNEFTYYWYYSLKQSVYLFFSRYVYIFSFLFYFFFKLILWFKFFCTTLFGYVHLCTIFFNKFEFSTIEDYFYIF